MTVRAIIARAMLLCEGLISFPVFLLAWFGSAIVLAAKAGFDFAKAEDDAAKAAGLRRMLGERADR